MSEPSFQDKIRAALSDVKAKQTEDAKSADAARQAAAAERHKEEERRAAAHGLAVRFSDKHLVPLLKELQTNDHTTALGLRFMGDYGRDDSGVIINRLKHGDLELSTHINYLGEAIVFAVNANRGREVLYRGNNTVSADAFNDEWSA